MDICDELNAHQTASKGRRKETTTGTVEFFSSAAYSLKFYKIIFEERG
jgi:hypothetical protein